MFGLRGFWGLQNLRVHGFLDFELSSFMFLGCIVLRIFGFMVSGIRCFRVLRCWGFGVLVYCSRVSLVLAFKG